MESSTAEIVSIPKGLRNHLFNVANYAKYVDKLLVLSLSHRYYAEQFSARRKQPRCDASQPDATDSADRICR